MYRQGDVLLRVCKLPVDAKVVERVAGKIVLAYGEATGHTHAIYSTSATEYSTSNKRYLSVVEAPAELQHEEHATVVIEPNTYEIIRQREYANEDEYRNVSD